MDKIKSYIIDDMAHSRFVRCTKFYYIKKLKNLHKVLCILQQLSASFKQLHMTVMFAHFYRTSLELASFPFNAQYMRIDAKNEI